MESPGHGTGVVHSVVSASTILSTCPVFIMQMDLRLFEITVGIGNCCP